jgi:hypothetical protein
MFDVSDPPGLIVSELGLAAIVKSGVKVIVKVRVCEWLRLSLMPTIVIAVVWAGVPASTLIVAVDVTLPPEGGVTGFGENPTWTPAGNAPDVARFTGELKPAMDVTVTVSVPELPDPTVSADELNVSEKSAPEVIVRSNVVVWVGPPVPLTVIVLVPVGALPSTLIVSVATAAPPEGMLIGLGLNAEKVTPDGTEPVIESVTGPT